MLKLKINNYLVDVDTNKNIAIINDKEYKVMFHHSKLKINGDSLYIHFHDKDSLKWVYCGGDCRNDIEIINKEDEVKYSTWINKLENDIESLWTDEMALDN